MRCISIANFQTYIVRGGYTVAATNRGSVPRSDHILLPKADLSLIYERFYGVTSSKYIKKTTVG